MEQAIDKITSVEVRKQLQRRMYQLHREMQDLERRKENLLESVQAERFIRANAETDVGELQASIRKIRLSLDKLSTQLGTQQNFNGQQFEDRMNRDLRAKFYYLLQARHEPNRDKLIQQLKEAITKIREARKAVAECRTNLEKDL